MMNPTKKLFIVACEASGDSHASRLIEALRRLDPALQFHGLGGPKMKQAGLNPLYDMTKISALGLGDVLRLYFLYRDIFYDSLSVLTQIKPDALILVDSPAFNLRFAKKVRNQFPDIPIFYYICPQIWAWGAQRIRTVKKNITKMYSILPFEAAFYQKAGMDCEFVGHPLLDEEMDNAWNQDEARNYLQLPRDSKIIGLLPGSRKSEIQRILPIMIKTADLMHAGEPKSIFYLGISPNVEMAVYDRVLSQIQLPVRKFSDNFSQHIAGMDFALVASGTATLQTALIGTPFFLLYKTSWSTYFLGKQLIKVPYLGLVNLLAGKTIIPEFIQKDAKPETLAHEALVLLQNPAIRDEMKKEFLAIRGQLGAHGASENTARLMLKFLNVQNAATKIPAPQPVHN